MDGGTIKASGVITRVRAWENTVRKVGFHCGAIKEAGLEARTSDSGNLVNSGPGWGLQARWITKLIWFQVDLDNCASKTQTTVSYGGKKKTQERKVNEQIQFLITLGL